MTSDPHNPDHVIDAIMRIMEAAFDPVYGEAWNRRQVRDALTMPSTHAIVVDGNGNALIDAASVAPAGFVLTRHAADEEEILLIAVHPEYRRKGIGARLIEHLFARAAERGTVNVFLEMRRSNPAERLYRQAGFEPIGSRPNYYRLADGSRIDAITFGRAI